MKSRWNEAEAAQLTGPLGPRIYTSRLLGQRKVAGAARRRQHVGQAARERRVRRGARRAVRERQRRGPRDDQRGELRAVAAALPAEARTPAGAVRFADAERAQHPRPALRRAVAFGRDPAARPTPLQVRRPHPRRRGAGDLQRSRWREAHARDLRRARRGHALRHGGIQAGGALRARISEAGERQDGRHGAGVARHLHLRRRGARVLRAHDRAGDDGRGISAEEKGLAHFAAAEAGPARRARRDRRPAARDFRAGRLSRAAESQRRRKVPHLRAASQARGACRRRARRRPITWSSSSRCRCSDATRPNMRRATAPTSSATPPGRRRPCSTRRRARCSIRSSASPPPAATRARRRSSKISTTTASTSSCAPRRSAAGTASARTTCSTSSTGSSSRRRHARPPRRPCSGARWRWSPAPRPASARPVPTLSCGAAPR